MRAVWYDRQGAADEALTWGELPTPDAGHGEVRVKLEASGVIRRTPIDAAASPTATIAVARINHSTAVDLQAAQRRGQVPAEINTGSASESGFTTGSVTAAGWEPRRARCPNMPFTSTIS